MNVLLIPSGDQGDASWALCRAQGFSTRLSGSLKMKAAFCVYKPFTLKIRASLLRFGAQAASQAQGLRE